MFSKPRRSTGRFVVIGLILGFLVTPSCVFEPRDTQPPPEGQTGEDIQMAQDPEVVIDNLIRVIYRLDSANYPDLFSEDFAFVPDPEDVDFMNNHYGPGIYLGWDKVVETTMTDRLFDRIQLKAGAELTLLDTTVSEETDTTYVVYHGYFLETLPKGATWKFFSGEARFHLRKDPSDNLWYMFRWEDFRLDDVPDSVNGTWGLLKGEIRATT